MEQEKQYTQKLEFEKEEEEREIDEDEVDEEILEMLMKVMPPNETEEEEEEQNKQEEIDQKIAKAFQEFWEKEDTFYRKRMEQEREDYELALFLSQVPYDIPEEMCFAIKSSASTEVQNSIPKKFNRSPLVRSIQEAQGKQKYDFTKWKYSELRDTINSSCDIELLEACKIEFHRRLKVYHAWKAKSRKWDDNQRAPSSILEEGNKPKHIPLKMPINNVTQRYFRIPFVRPAMNQAARGEKRGWWYAHFDGQYVARQMELHPEKQAILLTAGSDDMQMCELSLDETGLTRKRGAEILEQEFNREWEKNGGKTYIKPCEESSI